MHLRLGARTFGPQDVAVMAVLNRTPDSFYDGGSTYDLDAALARLEEMVAEGADIVDVGGVRAGAGAAVDATEELRRTADIVALARERYPALVISVDTWRSEVASVLCDLGADLVNDTWAGYDPALAAVAAEHGAGLVCSHTGGLEPRSEARRPMYDDVAGEVVAELTMLATRAVSEGVRPDGVLVDPTHDFGKTTAHSLELTRRLDEVVATGWPVLVALSRKDFVGETLDLPPRDRLAGTLTATALSAERGARVFRTHDVRATRQCVDMVASIMGWCEPTAPRRGLG